MHISLQLCASCHLPHAPALPQKCSPLDSVPHPLDLCLEDSSLELRTYLPAQGIARIRTGLQKSEGRSDPMFEPDFRLYPWQAECLNWDDGSALALAQPRNLVYSSPTSGGKTLVALTLLLRRILATHRPALLVFPFKALCDEMADRLEPILDTLGRQTQRMYGSNVNRRLVHPKTGVIVAVIEKAHMLVNKLLENEFQHARAGDDEMDPDHPRLSDLSCIVVDELHSVGDGERGALLEETLAKVMYAQGKWKEESERAGREGGGGGLGSLPMTRRPSGGGGPGTPSQVRPPWIQVVGMSATINNFGEVAAWLRAALYVSKYRPVRLQQYLRVSSCGIVKREHTACWFGRSLSLSTPHSHPKHVYSLSAPPEQLPGQKVGDVSGPVLIELKDGAAPTTLRDALSTTCVAAQRPLGPPAAPDDDNLIALVQETLDEGGSLLVFCPTKHACTDKAKKLAAALGSVPVRGGSEKDRDELVDKLKRIGKKGAGAKLLDLVKCGLAFHNSDLIPQERERVEGGFKAGLIRVLFCTSTLAAGVNLPARRVIITCPYVGTAANVLSASNYRQMCGRAGRKGLDDRGEAILLFGAEYLRTGEGKVDQALSVIFAQCLVDSKLQDETIKRAVMVRGAGGEKEDEDWHCRDGSNTVVSFSGMHGFPLEIYISSFPSIAIPPPFSLRSLQNLIATGAAKTREDLLTYLGGTLLHLQRTARSEGAALPAQLGEAMERLSAARNPMCRFLVRDPAGDMRPTPLAIAATEAGMTPEEALRMYEELREECRKGVILLPETDLHLFYLLTPPRPATAELQAPQWRALGDRIKEMMQQANSTAGGDTREHIRQTRLAESSVVDRILTMEGGGSQRQAREYVIQCITRIANSGVPLVRPGGSRPPPAHATGTTNSGASSGPTTAASAECTPAALPPVPPILKAGGSGSGGGGAHSRRAAQSPAEALRSYEEGMHRWTRLYNCFVLYDRLSEDRTWTATRYNAEFSLHILREQAELYSFRVVRFLERLGWRHMHDLMSGYHARIALDSRLEITSLMEVPGVGQIRAKALYRAGFTDPEALANAPEEQLAEALRSASEWDSERRLRAAVAKMKRGAREVLEEKEQEVHNKVLDRLKCAQGFNGGVESGAAFLQGGVGGKRPAPGRGGRGGSGSGRGGGAKRPRLEFAPVLPFGVPEAPRVPMKSELERGGAAPEAPDPWAMETEEGQGAGVDDRPNLVFVRSLEELRTAVSEVQTALAERSALLPDGDAITRENRFAFAFTEGREDELTALGPLPMAHGGAQGAHAPPEDRKAMGLPGVEGVSFCYWREGDGVRTTQLRLWYVPLTRCSDWRERWAAVTDLLTFRNWPVNEEIHAQAKAAAARERRERPGMTDKEYRDRYRELVEREFTRRRPLTITFGLKNQLRLLLQGRRRALEQGRLRPEEAEALVPVRCDRLAVDVRLLAWLLKPHLPEVKDDRDEVRGALDNLMALCAAIMPDSPDEIVQWFLPLQAKFGPRNPAPALALLSLYLLRDKAAAIAQARLELVLSRLESPMCFLLADMEDRGIALDVPFLDSLREQIKRAQAVLQAEAERCLGRPLDLDSAEDVRVALLEDPARGGLGLKLPPDEHLTSTKTGNLSLAKEVLAQMTAQHPVCQRVLDFRSLRKRLEYVELLAKFAQGAVPGAAAEWVIRGTFFQTTVDTGRLSMKDPSLQTIPRPTTLVLGVESSRGPDLTPGGTLHINLRRAFVPRPGFVLFSADYSQLEFRIMAHLSGEPKLIECFNAREDADPFVELAARWLLSEPEDLEARIAKVASEPELRTRNQAKQLLYALIYGMGKQRLSALLGATMLEATRMQQAFLGSMPHLKAWIDETRAACVRNMSVQTVSGRTRALERYPGERDGDGVARRGLNTRVQGSAADLVKSAMKPLFNALQELAASKGREVAHILLQIHDELLIEVREEHADEVAGHIGQHMSKADRRLAKLLQPADRFAGPLACRDMEPFRVPLPVKLRWGRSWGDLVPWRPGDVAAALNLVGPAGQP